MRALPRIRLRVRSAQEGKAGDEKGAVSPASAAASPIRLQSYRLPVFGLMLPEEGERLEQRLQSVPGIVAVNFDFLGMRLELDLDATACGLSAAQAAVRREGFELSVPPEEGDAPQRRYWVQGVVATLSAVAAVTVDIVRTTGILRGMGGSVALDVAEVGLVLLAVVATVWGLWRTRWEEHDESGFSWPLFLALAGVVAFAGCTLLAARRGNAPFIVPAGCCLVAYVSAWLRGALRDKANLLERRLWSCLPDEATVERAGRLFVVPAERVAHTDKVLVEAGARCPVDGIVLEGVGKVASEFPARFRNGEPAKVVIGSEMVAGTLLSEGRVQVRPLHHGAERQVQAVLAEVGQGHWLGVPSGRTGDWRPLVGWAVQAGIAAMALVLGLILGWDGLVLFHVVIGILVAPPVDLALASVGTIRRHLAFRLVAEGIVAPRPEQAVPSSRDRALVIPRAGRVASPGIVRLLHVLGGPNRAEAVAVPKGLFEGGPSGEDEAGRTAEGDSKGALDAVAKKVAEVQAGGRSVLVLTDAILADRLDLPGARLVVAESRWSGAGLGGSVVARTVRGLEDLAILYLAVNRSRRQQMETRLLALAGTVAALAAAVLGIHALMPLLAGALTAMSILLVVNTALDV